MHAFRVARILILAVMAMGLVNGIAVAQQGEPVGNVAELTGAASVSRDGAN